MLPTDSLYNEVGTCPMGPASDPKVIIPAYTYVTYWLALIRGRNLSHWTVFWPPGTVIMYFANLATYLFRLFKSLFPCTCLSGASLGFWGYMPSITFLHVYHGTRLFFRGNHLLLLSQAHSISLSQLQISFTGPTSVLTTYFPYHKLLLAPWGQPLVLMTPPIYQDLSYIKENSQIL